MPGPSSGKILVLGLACKKNVGDVRESPAAQDCVVLVTDHDAFDYPAIAAHAKLVVDTRGRYSNPLANLVKA